MRHHCSNGRSLRTRRNSALQNRITGPRPAHPGCRARNRRHAKPRNYEIAIELSMNMPRQLPPTSRPQLRLALDACRYRWRFPAGHVGCHKGALRLSSGVANSLKAHSPRNQDVGNGRKPKAGGRMLSAHGSERRLFTARKLLDLDWLWRPAMRRTIQTGRRADPRDDLLRRSTNCYLR
jgi:hypothetical protein